MHSINSRHLAKLEPVIVISDIFVDIENHVFWLKSLSYCQYTCWECAYQRWTPSVSASLAHSHMFIFIWTSLVCAGPEILELRCCIAAFDLSPRVRQFFLTGGTGM